MKMINKKFYVARDENGSLFLFVGKKPEKHEAYYENTSYWMGPDKNMIAELPKSLFPKLKWDDEEPIEVSIIEKKR
jgi:hypothetical protein